MILPLDPETEVRRLRLQASLDGVPVVLRSRLVFDGHIKVQLDDVLLPSGRQVEREVAVRPAGVVVVAEDEDRLLFVRQHRHAVRRSLVELPAGNCEVGEMPEVAAARELGEETGYEPGCVKALGGFFLAPGFSTGYLHAFRCSELHPSAAVPDPDEDLMVVRLTLPEALEQVGLGGIQDAKTLATLLLYQERRLA